MIKKCDFPGCTKAGTHRAPRDRTLSSYYWFCREHAAEYNKNWNYYGGMSDAEIIAENERDEVSGLSDLTDDRAVYAEFLNDILSGKITDEQIMRAHPINIQRALKTFGLPQNAKWTDITARWRKLAKLHHPDTSGNSAEFIKITNSFSELRKYFKK